MVWFKLFIASQTSLTDWVNATTSLLISVVKIALLHSSNLKVPQRSDLLSSFVIFCVGSLKGGVEEHLYVNCVRINIVGKGFALPFSTQNDDVDCGAARGQMNCVSSSESFP